MISGSASRRAAGVTATQAKASEQTPASIAHALGALERHHRDTLLETVAAAARELLRSSDLVMSLTQVAERIGLASGVDRAHIFLIDSAGGRCDILHHSLWVAPGIATPPEFLHPSEPLANVGMKAWLERLEQGETITGHVREFEGGKRTFFELGGVKSILAVPIFAETRWLGLIGFDDCRNEREWSVAEIDALKTMAELIGAAVARDAHLKSLADAQRIIERSPTILYRLSPEPPFALTYVSQNVQRYGYAAEELLAKPERWMTLIEPVDLPSMMANINLLIEGKADRIKTPFTIKKADGSPVSFDSEGYALRDATGKLTGIEGILSDITDRKRAQGELNFSHILLTTAIESSPDAILIVDANNRIIKYNRNMMTLWNIPHELMLAGDDTRALATVANRIKHKDDFLARVRYLYDHPEIQSHEELELTDGRVVDRHSGALYDSQQIYLGRIWFFRDITNKKRAEERIATLARTDSLTGIANRAVFLDRLNLEFARARRGGAEFALHYIDLDHFKDINDTLGHPMGDRLLLAVAERLKGCLRDTDLVARFGGDEFAVLQDGVTDVSQVETFATKIGRALAQPFTLVGNQVCTSASIGVVPYRRDIVGPDAMMMMADLALYRAKDEGRNQFRLHVAALDDETRERMLMGEDLRHAVERGQLELYYQPEVELKSGALVGLEALIRWHHPRRGMMLPATFISIAESTGSIVEIGQWAVDTACRQIQAWNERGIAPPVVAVNLSGAQFKLAGHIDAMVADAMARYDVRPGQLELELTETVLVESIERHGETFKRLRQAGVRLAIDDFGTGYSSLNYLRSFHVSRLKIAQRFIEHVTTCADDAAIVRAAIGLAHELGIEVLAEGVETQAQREFLIAAGCTFAQGFYFGRPGADTATDKILRREQPQLAS
jgi:diguanylate cyclase (GGDEF)-like protein/PAS domain S-box-containing protein